MTPGMDDVCTRCGETYGEHRGIWCPRQTVFPGEDMFISGHDRDVRNAALDAVESVIASVHPNTGAQTRCAASYFEGHCDAIDDIKAAIAKLRKGER